MIRTLKAVLLSTLFIFGLGVATYSPVVIAADPLAPVCDEMTPEAKAKSATCAARTNKNPLTGTDGLLMKVANIVAIIAGIAAVLMIIVGGFRMITANGDSQGFGSARSTVIGAVVGLIIIILARSIVVLILEKL